MFPFFLTEWEPGRAKNDVNSILYAGFEFDVLENPLTAVSNIPNEFDKLAEKNLINYYYEGLWGDFQRILKLA